MNQRDAHWGSHHLMALRLLCESVYQPTENRRDAILEHDWSELPRVARVIGELPAPVSPAAVSAAAWHLLDEATRELAPSFPPMPGTVTALEIVRLHVLERQPWVSLEAQLREEGRPVSRGTLIRRQHDFLPYLCAWASFDGVTARTEVERAPVAEAAEPIVPVSIPNPVPAQPSASPRIPRAWLLPAVVGSLVIALGVGWSSFGGRGAHSGADAPVLVPLVPTELEGRTIPGFQNGGPLPERFPRLDVPRLPGQRVAGMVIEREFGQPKILLTHQLIGDPAPHFRLWDPIAKTMVWESSFLPPAQERLTHDGVGDEVLDESYYVTRSFHAGPGTDLGHHAALILSQKYSPTFAIFVDLETGQVDGRYVHPGHAVRGAVLDLDRDGRGELVLGGTDNSIDRPVVIALEPFEGVRAASTVSWNVSREEGALHRVILPRWEPGEVALGTTRFVVCEWSESYFDLHSRILTVGVGGHLDTVFHVRLDSELRPAATNPLLLWDNDHYTLATHGLEMPPLEELKNQIVEATTFARSLAP